MGEPRLRANWMIVLEARNLLFVPTMISIRFDANRFDITSGIVIAHTDVDSVLHHRPQHLAQTLALPGFSSLPIIRRM